MSTIQRICVVLTCMLLSTGCVTYWHGKEMRADILALRGQMDHLIEDHRKQKKDLETTTLRLQKRLAALDKHLESLRTNSANSGSNLDEMRQTVQDLHGQLAELKFKLGKQDRDISDMTPPKMEPLPTGRRALFNFGVKKFESDDCATSSRAFTAFADRFPKDSNTDNALSFIGDCQNRRGQYRDALRTLKQILDKFPKGEKVDDALFLMHKSLVGLGKCKKAKVFLKTVVTDHPKSNRIKSAKAALKNFDKTCR